MDKQELNINKKLYSMLHSIVAYKYKNVSTSTSKQKFETDLKTIWRTLKSTSTYVPASQRAGNRGADNGGSRIMRLVEDLRGALSNFKAIDGEHANMIRSALDALREIGNTIADIVKKEPPPPPDKNSSSADAICRSMTPLLKSFEITPKVVNGLLRIPGNRYYPRVAIKGNTKMISVIAVNADGTQYTIKGLEKIPMDKLGMYKLSNALYRER